MLNLLCNIFVFILYIVYWMVLEGEINQSALPLIKKQSDERDVVHAKSLCVRCLRARGKKSGDDDVTSRKRQKQSGCLLWLS